MKIHSAHFPPPLPPPQPYAPVVLNILAHQREFQHICILVQIIARFAHGRISSRDPGARVSTTAVCCSESLLERINVPTCLQHHEELPATRTRTHAHPMAVFHLWSARTCGATDPYYAENEDGPDTLHVLLLLCSPHFRGWLRIIYTYICTRAQLSLPFEPNSTRTQRASTYLYITLPPRPFSTHPRLYPA